MASLRRIPGSKFWYACFTLPDGRRTQRATREIDRKKAQKLADTYEEATRARQTARAAQRVIADIFKRVTGERLPSSKVRDYFETWLARKKPETADGTYQFYQSKAEGFLTFLGDRADSDIARLGAPDVLAFRKAEADRVSATTVNHGIKFLRMVFEQARRDGLLVDNPAADVAVLKKKKDDATISRRPFTLPELQQLLAVVDEEWRSLIFFGFYTGQRLGDLCRLTWANVDLVQGELRFTTGKTGRKQIIPLATPLWRTLQARGGGGRGKEPLHPHALEVVTREGKTGTLSRQFYGLMATAGLVAPKTHKKAVDGITGLGRNGRRSSSEISFHALRHTATSLLKNAGISSPVVQEFIGHDSSTINAHYTHIETASMRRAADALPDLTSAIS